MREIRTLRAMWRGLETTHGSDTEALSTETESKQSRPNLRSIGASPRPYRDARHSITFVYTSLDFGRLIVSSCSLGKIGSFH